MADKVTQSKILGVGIQHGATDQTSKTTYIKIPNPKENLTESVIKTAIQFYISSGILGNDEGGTLINPVIKTAYTETVETTELDIGFSD